VATLTSMQPGSRWQRHFFSRQESIKTTWKFRLAILMLVLLLGFVSRGCWIMRIGQSLVCTEEIGPSDIILVENFDPNYLIFERAAALHKAGLAVRVLVPTQASRDPTQLNLVSQGIVEVMARVVWLPNPEMIPIRESEPISLNAAYQIRDFLTKEHLRSVIVVTPGFRSQRSALVYHAVLGPAGIKVDCVPVFGQKNSQELDGDLAWHPRGRRTVSQASVL